MKTINILFIILLNSCSYNSIKAHKKLILVIGDSISLGYTPYLQSDMSQYDIIHPKDNCRNSWYTLQNIDMWINQLPHKPDIIIWNNGIWNTIHDYHDEPIERLGTSIEQYQNDMTNIAIKLKSITNEVYFNTTTHITPNNSIFNAGYENDLNNSVIDIMNNYKIHIIDLNTVSISLESNKIDAVHFDTQGYKKIAEYIEKELKF